MNKLTVTVGIGVDRDRNYILRLERAVILNLIREEALALAGGVTITQGEGSWLHPSDGALVTETVVTVAVVGEFAREEALQVAGRIRDHARQECVAFEFTPAVDFLLV